MPARYILTLSNEYTAVGEHSLMIEIRINTSMSYGVNSIPHQVPSTLDPFLVAAMSIAYRGSWK